MTARRLAVSESSGGLGKSAYSGWRWSRYCQCRTVAGAVKLPDLALKAAVFPYTSLPPSPCRESRYCQCRTVGALKLPKAAVLPYTSLPPSHTNVRSSDCCHFPGGRNESAAAAVRSPAGAGGRRMPFNEAPASAPRAAARARARACRPRGATLSHEHRPPGLQIRLGYGEMTKEFRLPSDHLESLHFGAHQY